MVSDDERAENIRLIRDSARAFVPADGSLGRIRQLRFVAPGFDRQTWREMCEMGWLGLKVPETTGGAGFGMQELCTLAEEFGRGLVPEPLITAALSVSLFGDAIPAEVLSGERVVLPAWQEKANAALEPGGATTLTDGRLFGAKRFVHQVEGADAFLVVNPDWVALVERDTPGLKVTSERTQDGGFVGTVTFDGAKAALMTRPNIARAFDEATLATAAYLLGVMSRAFEISLDYLRVRKQFDKPIGSFQALQHRATDLKTQIELTRASVAAAARTLDNGASGETISAAVSQAKHRASEAVMLVTRESVQLHGAIGYTDESDIGLFVRKAMTLANSFGSATAHRARYARVAPLPSAA